MNRLAAPLPLLAVALVACSSGTVPSPGAATTGRPLFAAVENHSTTPHTYDTVVIADAAGTIHASHAIRPRAVPCIGPAVPLLQPPAQTAAGAVYYADGDGTVHRLTPAGADSVVTRFPVDDPQAELSFAVSPDGSHLMASIVTYPPRITPPAGGSPVCYVGDRVHLAVLRADAGGPATVARQTDLIGGSGVIQMVGWDATGPIGTVNTLLGTQQPLPEVWHGAAAHLNPSGQPGAVIGGADCRAQAIAANGAVACEGGGYTSVSVRDASGKVVIQVPPPSSGYLGLPVLRPDGAAVAMALPDQAAAGATLYRQDGGTVRLPGLQPVGWLDATTLVMVDNQSVDFLGAMSAVHLEQPDRAVGLGFKGTWVGVVR